VTSRTLTPSRAAKAGLQVNQDGVVRSAFDLMRYPDVDWARLSDIWPELAAVDAKIAQQVEIDAKYAMFLARQDDDVLAFRRDEALALPEALDYAAISSLSSELKSKLALARPATLGAAARVQGITPAALTALLAYVRKRAA
jgi:tRNA uridine 5-carboxymethylaminomethyl modification enzyme